MASVGPKSPGTSSSSDQGLGSIIPWTNPNNNQSSDNAYATAICSLVNGDFTEYLTATNFDFSAIPASATIEGIVVEIEKSASGSIVDNSVKLIVAGSVSGDEKKDGAAWPGSDAYTTYGGIADRWGLFLTTSQVKASDFGVGISATRSGGISPTASVDHVRMTVYYREDIFISVTGGQVL